MGECYMVVTVHELALEEIDRKLFCSFVRRQEVNLCLRREGDGWVVRPDPFIDDWSEAEYAELIDCLKNTVRTDGRVWGAFVDGVLKGFASVEGGIFGKTSRYMDLSCIHVSQDMRHSGIGRRLFDEARRFARARGAQKLYISAHSAVESQAFYEAMGCVDAQEIQRAHAEKEPFDRQLECML